MIQLIESRSEKCYLWREQLRRINPQNEPTVESPADSCLQATNSHNSVLLILEEMTLAMNCTPEQCIMWKYKMLLK